MVKGTSFARRAHSGASAAKSRFVSGFHPVDTGCASCRPVEPFNQEANKRLTGILEMHGNRLQIDEEHSQVRGIPDNNVEKRNLLGPCRHCTLRFAVCLLGIGRVDLFANAPITAIPCAAKIRKTAGRRVEKIPARQCLRPDSTVLRRALRLFAKSVSWRSRRPSNPWR